MKDLKASINRFNQYKTDNFIFCMFGEYEKIPNDKVSVTFTDDEVKLDENATIGYSEIERVFITEDLIILIWNKKITVLQKKDLSSGNIKEFIDFITYKSNNLFEIVNI